MTSNPIDRYIEWRSGTPEMQHGGNACHAICHAPFVSVLLDPKGYLRSCCQSVTHSIGNITKQSLREIWDGGVNREVRRRMMADDLPDGCATCRWDIGKGNFDEAFARHFDALPVPAAHPAWPQNMWFMLSNACNLECVQCYGELSSSIRKNRDHLPPLERVYGDEFFDELREFLPHLRIAVFLGGEAFLSRENYRVWDMMIDDGIATPSHIVTNGTVFNQRVERVVQALPCSISISLDGATKQTVESIRCNADFDEIMINVERFQQHADVGLSFCLMPQNHHEFADFLLLAERLGCDASVNTVFHPAEYSLWALPADELARIVDAWHAQADRVLPQLDRHGAVWQREFSRLKRWLACPDGPPGTAYLTGISARMDLAAEPGAGAARELSWARDTLRQWSGRAADEAALDRRDVITCSAAWFGGLAGAEVEGRSLSAVLMLLRERYGEDVCVVRDECAADAMDRTMEFTDLRGHKTELRWIVSSPSDCTSNERVFLVAVRGRVA